MKPLPCTDFISLGLVVAALLAATLTHAFAAEGDLDVAFDPAISPPAHGLYRPYQDHVYFPQESPSRIARLRDDGSLDPDWSLPTDVAWRDFICLPAGGFAVLGVFGLDLAWTESSLSRVAPTDFLTAGVLRLFARRDGSVIQANTFTEGRGEDVVQDREERLVAVGGFIRARNEERLGLVRFHRSGQIDPRWNPAPALGIALENATNLTAWPYGVALGPSNSVVVAVRLEPGESESRDLLATIDEQGEVTMSLLVTNALSHLQPVVQPDGRIIVVGGFTNWNGHAVTGIVRLQPDGTWDPTFEVTLKPERGRADRRSPHSTGRRRQGSDDLSTH